MINAGPPDDWKQLQAEVAKILNESGLEAEIEKTITTVRGLVEIDVFAREPKQPPPSIYICECKQWKSNVPKTVVHSLRTVVNDSGANWGMIISSKGFQKGAYEAAVHSNIKLLNWHEFESLFEERWYKSYMQHKLYEEVDALVDYTEPVNSRVFGKADKLPEASQKKFIELRSKWASLAFLALRYGSDFLGNNTSVPQLPLKKYLKPASVPGESKIPDDLLEAISLRELLDRYLKHIRAGTAAFDEVFGGRA